MKNISDQEQRKRFLCFSKTHFTFTGRVPLALPVFLAVLSGMVLVVPMKDFLFPQWYLIEFMILWIPYFLLSPYLLENYQNQPNRKQQKIYQVLQYLPISRKQIRRQLAEYLWDFLWKFCVITALLQTVSSCIAGSFRIFHILEMLIMTMVLPMASGLLFLWQHTRE